jgi:hypothetical protein
MLNVHLKVDFLFFQTPTPEQTSEVLETSEVSPHHDYSCRRVLVFLAEMSGVRSVECYK